MAVCVKMKSYVSGKVSGNASSPGLRSEMPKQERGISFVFHGMALFLLHSRLYPRQGPRNSLFFKGSFNPEEIKVKSQNKTHNSDGLETG